MPAQGLATFTILRRCAGCGLHVCNRSAERWCSQVAAIIGFRLHGFRKKANSTITKLVLERNEIGDAGASALAESLRATFVTCVL